MATTTTNNGATVDNLNVLDTSTADGTNITLLEVANALFSTTNATQTVTIDTAFWNGQLGLTFAVSNQSSTSYYTLYGAGIDAFTLVQTDSLGNALVIGSPPQFQATTMQSFLSAVAATGLQGASYLTSLDITGGAGKNVFQTTVNGQIADIFSYASANDSFNGTGSQWDVINGFNQGVDKIDLRKLVADSSYAGANTAVKAGYAELVWTKTASGKYGVWTTSDGSGGSFVYADTNGDGVADLKIDVAGVTGLQQTDFWGVGADKAKVTINAATPIVMPSIAATAVTRTSRRFCRERR